MVKATMTLLWGELLAEVEFQLRQAMQLQVASPGAGATGTLPAKRGEVLALNLRLLLLSS